MQAAERQVEVVHTLPSAREPRKVQPWEKVLQAAAAPAAVLASQAAGPAWQVAGAATCGLALGVSGHRRGSLSVSGAWAAAVVGTATLAASLRCGATLLAFYVASSRLTAYRERAKAVDDEFKPGGQRDWVQVCCNATVPSLLAIAAAVFTRARDAPIGLAGRPAAACLGGVLGYFACCCGDTWASELGQLSEDKPRLITTMQPVRTGTNGGVTKLGLAASAAGGLFVGLVFYCAALASPTLLVMPGQAAAAAQQWQLVPLGVLGGIFGSVADSVLGATVQYSGFSITTQRITGRPGPKVHRIAGHPLLSNNGVNLVSASMTAALVAWLVLLLF
ncbi:hypothetical protein WJX81_005893 [Elliptochloris bilobata]|uniref:Transmembrane protein 19 n=1 Tax=Elliptochloris bilobata TaxID=381761 RepID=A0AAW1QIP8_9CHLO